MKILITGFLATLLVVQYGYAQKAPAKYGDVPIDQLKMSTYDKDSSAAAVVLVDFGESQLKYNQEKGFYISFERLRRIKILKTEGLDNANIKIRTYQGTSGEEKITSLKATTSNLENGKIVETKMKNDGVFKEEYDKNWNITNFTLPNVKVGSVIEYTYTIDSDFLSNFQDWEFQSSIPTVISEYRARIPEYFHYEKYTQGYIPFDVAEQTSGTNSITLHYKERSENYSGGPTKFSDEKVDFTETRYRWVIKNVPAFKDEPFLTTSDDYISKINFELASTKFPNQPIKPYMGTWEDINKLYVESSDFGGEVTGNGFLKKTVEEVTAGLTTPEQKIEAISNYVKRKITWNGKSRSFSSSVLKKVVEEGKGNSAEINLILTSMLDKAGVTANPVLISTRDHGFIREMYPASTQFNYVLSYVKYDDKEIILDATESLLPYNVLPERCLNGRGLVISKVGSRWVNLSSGIKTKTIAKAILKMNAEGQLAGELTMERTGYDALEHRKVFLSKGEADYVKDFVGAKEWMLNKSTFENAKETSKLFKEKHEIEVSNHVSVSGDVMYINPFLLLQQVQNPFKSEKREYPVDFGFAKDEMYIVTLTLPDGYVVDELPQSKIFMLPDNASKYIYNIGANGNVINLTSSLSINKSLFTQLEYPDIREYFNKVVAKQAEQIVLKRKLN